MKSLKIFFEVTYLKNMLKIICEFWFCTDLSRIEKCLVRLFFNCKLAFSDRRQILLLTLSEIRAINDYYSSWNYQNYCFSGEIEINWFTWICLVLEAKFDDDPQLTDIKKYVIDILWILISADLSANSKMPTRHFFGCKLSVRPFR